MLKVSQRFLDSHIPALIPEDSALLNLIPDNMEYSKDPAVFERFWDVFSDKEGMELLKKEEHYGMYRKEPRVDTSFDQPN